MSNDTDNTNLNTELIQFAKNITVPLFGTSENLQEAINYAYAAIESLKQEDRIGAYTVLHVVLNTVALEMRRLAGDPTANELTMLGGDDENE